MVNTPLHSSDQILVKNESEQGGSSRCPFPALLSASRSHFLFKRLLVSNEKFPSFYFKYHRKSDFDSSCLHGCDARRGVWKKAKAPSLPTWRCAKWLISQIFLKFHRCEAASANENFRGFLKSKVKGAKSGT